MPRGGARPGGGRPKGVPNKASIARQARIASTGPTPLDAMIRKMRWWAAKADRELAKPEPDDALIEMALDNACDAACAAAPYVHPKLAAVAHVNTTQHVDVRKLTDAELMAYLVADEAHSDRDRGGADIIDLAVSRAASP